MALPRIKLLFGEPVANPWGGFYDALSLGVLQPPTTTQIVISAPDGSRIVFNGDFDVVGGDVTGGTMTDYTAFAGSTKMQKASGFEIDGAALFDALQNYDMDSAPFFNLLFGSALNIVGSNQDDFIEGTIGGDKLIGKAGNDRLWGWDGDDVLKGGKGNDFLHGGDGFDMLVGGKGDDVFGFSLDPMSPPVGFGKIKDMHVGEDLIGLTVFDDILPPGFLDKKYFHKGTEAATADQVIIYDKSTGKLYFDVDGTGIEAQFQFARVTPSTKLNADDFIVSGGLMVV